MDGGWLFQTQVFCWIRWERRYTFTIANCWREQHPKWSSVTVERMDFRTNFNAESCVAAPFAGLKSDALVANTIVLRLLACFCRCFVVAYWHGPSFTVRDTATNSKAPKPRKSSQWSDKWWYRTQTQATKKTYSSPKSFPVRRVSSFNNNIVIGMSEWRPSTKVR